MPSIKVELPYANMKMEISPLISKLYMRSARFSRYLCPSLPLVFLKQPVNRPMHREKDKKSPFFQAQRLYFYFYDGRYQRTKDGVIDIYEKKGESGKYEATLTICSVSANGRSSEIFYTGKVLYSDMLIRFSFVNQYNPLEEDLLYIFNPLELRDFTTGLLCGISSADLMPCAFKCVITLKPQELTEAFRHQLLFTKKDLKRWEQLNMLLIDNMEK